MIKSPITGGETRLMKSIPTKTIINLYKKYTDVSRFFTDIDTVDVYECTDTGYRFYYPLSLAGDGKFYEDLSSEELYYVPWKAEHEIADSYIKTGDKVLELGCATGDFLVAEVAKKSITPYGTELNLEAKKKATSRGVIFDSITSADLVCAFQVLEHIADIRSFVTTAINSTKTGGHIVFGVPNNNSLIKDDTVAFLNMPPHHMGLWTRSSLGALPKYFPIDLVAIHEETLQPNHYRWYYQVYYGDKLLSLGMLGKIINKLVFTLFAQFLIRYNAEKIKGHTIVAVYKKRNV